MKYSRRIFLVMYTWKNIFIYEEKNMDYILPYEKTLPLLKTKNLTKLFGPLIAVKGV